MDFLGFVHTVCAVVALASGLGVVIFRKGTARHRQLGRLYVASMVLLNGTALVIYDLFGGFGPFHVAAVVSLSTVCAGFVPVYFRRPRATWLTLHSQAMSWSAVGLLAAAAAEFVTRVPGTDFGWGVVVPTLAITAVGGWVIHTRTPRISAAVRSPESSA